MEDYVLDPTFELAPMGHDGGVCSGDAVVGRLQLLVKGHGCQDDFVAVGRELGRVSIEGGLEVLKPVVELGNVAVVFESGDV